MKKNRLSLTPLLSFLLILLPLSAGAQQPATVQEEEVSPESFTTTLKDEWTYLRDGIEQLNKETAARGEFETTSEFQIRTAHARQSFIEKLNTHIKDAKLDRKIFGVWFNATLVSYNADAGVYSVQCPTTVEAPYDIPTVVCSIPPNSYVGLADSILGGYRTSKIYLKFDTVFKWTVARKEAMAAKEAERTIYFKVRFTLDMAQPSFTQQAVIKIIPKEILLMNQVNKLVYWKGLCSTISVPAQEDDRANLKELKDDISQFIPMLQGVFKCSVKNVKISTDNGDRELIVTLLVKAKKDIISLAVDEIRALGAKDQIEPKIPPEKTNKVITLDRLISGVFGFICAKSKALNININTQTIILLDIKATPINSISANRQNIYEAAQSEDYKQAFSIMTIKDL